MQVEVEEENDLDLERCLTSSDSLSEEKEDSSKLVEVDTSQ
jgi:hypothetical protein